MGFLTAAPVVVVFDVNETLSDMTPMADRFGDVGLPPAMAKLWFAALLRDGLAHAAAGYSAHFADVAEATLRSLMAGTPSDRGEDAAIDHVMQGFLGLGVHPDVPEGVRELRRAGLRLVALTNGATSTAQRLLASAGIDQEFERLLSVDDASTWKPSRAAYEYAATVCATAPAQMVLVAVHPWDIHGGARAGLSTAWLNRDSTPYPAHFAAPTMTAATLTELVPLIIGASAS